MKKKKYKSRFIIISCASIFVLAVVAIQIKFFKKDSLQSTDTKETPSNTSSDTTKLTEENSSSNSEVSSNQESEESNSSENNNTKSKKSEKHNSNKNSSSKKTEEKKYSSSSTFDYKNSYPNLYASHPKELTVSSKTAYLTFDDGPSKQTEKILDILAQENIKATFFVIGKEDSYSKNIMKRIVNEGHTIAVHTYTHDYKNIYASIENYLSDFNKIYNLIYDTTGVKPNIFRFPGGTFNGYNKAIAEELSNEMLRRGFLYYDWNVSNGDCNKNYSVNNCIKNVLKNSAKPDRIIVLMHDAPSKSYTVQALPDIIKGLRNQGFTFDKITNEVQPITLKKLS